jgi:hypothetical protein
MAGREGEKRFRIKIYASNGLMRAGAWAACWREMERVDVEIEPFVDGPLVAELEEFAAVAVVPKNEEHEEEGDGFVDEEVHDDTEHTREVESQVQQEAQMRAEQEEEMARTLIEEDELRQRVQDEEDMRRKLQDEERMREIYGQEVPPRQESRPRPSRRPSSRSTLEDDSLPDLLLKAFKVAMRDKKNVAICVLSVIVLLLALRPGSNVPKHSQVIMTDSAPAEDVVMNSKQEPIHHAVEVVMDAPKIVEDVLKDSQREAPVAKANSYVANEPVVEVENSAGKEPPIVQTEKTSIAVLENTMEATVEVVPHLSKTASAQEPVEEPLEPTEQPQQTLVEETVQM